MKVWARYFGLLILAEPLCLLLPTNAQEAAEEVPARGTNFTFTWSKVIGQPGDEVSMPVLFGHKLGAANVAPPSFDIATGAADQVIHFNPGTWIDAVPVMPDSPQTLIEPGEVRVSASPVMAGCFFFTH